MTWNHGNQILGTKHTGSKYGNKKTVLDGITFDSKGESQRYATLRIMERAGEIHDLQRQVPFDLQVNGISVAKYTADFTYRNAAGLLVVEDFKSEYSRRIASYRLKKKLMRACHGIEITEVLKK